MTSTEINLELTAGAINKGLMSGKMKETSGIFQILGIRKLEGKEGRQDRYRLNISDGIHSQSFTMLGIQMNHLILDGSIDVNCIIRADKVVCNEVQKRKVLVIIEMTVLAQGKAIGAKRGDPYQWTHVEEDSPSTSDNNKTAVVIAEPTAFMPIRDITPYTNNCYIRARVNRKSDIKCWSNNKGEGRLFSLDLQDEDGEIRATGFNQQVDQFYDQFEVNKIYFIVKYQVKPSNKQFNSLSHIYELTFATETKIIQCQSEVDEIPFLKFNFVPISCIADLKKDKTIDVLGICKSVGGVETMLNRITSKEVAKRDIVIQDQSNFAINLTIWGKYAEEYKDKSSTNSIIVVKGAKVSDYNGKSLSLLHDSIFQVNPTNVKEVDDLKNWFEYEGKNAKIQSLTIIEATAPIGIKWKSIKEAKNVTIIDEENGDFFICKVSLVDIKRDNCVYKGCPSPSCYKKLNDNNTGLYHCNKCDSDFIEFKWRYMVMAKFADFSDSTWASCFSGVSENIFGITADTFGCQDSTAAENCIKNAVYNEYICTLNLKMESYKDETHKKITVTHMTRIFHHEYARKLINEITEFAA